MANFSKQCTSAEAFAGGERRVFAHSASAEALAVGAAAAAYPRVRVIEEHLSPQAAAFLDIDYFAALPSTNAAIKEAMREGVSEGKTVIAAVQTQGYGRQGRLWSSLLGGIYLSLLLRPQDAGKPLQEIPALSLVLSLAVRSALMKLGCKVPVSLKWPNDVVSAQGKLCGISLEAQDGALCVGVGLNLFRPCEPQTLEGKNTPAYVGELIPREKLAKTLSFEAAPKGSSETPFEASSKAPSEAFTEVSPEGLSVSQVAFLEEATAILLSEIVCLYDTWLEKGFSVFRQEYQKHATLQGQFVKLVSQANGTLHEGVVGGIDERGCLVLTDAQGNTTFIHSGEVHLV
ncbi:MAG: biotin--[acetyl-CoA-carboxylase] ligase [Coriobacteriaceae bacterium]|jgi:BirA family biotin operon repressor/biotin-[acetyl-CoA-carboxylase] ligase|nr:biotin--[acetyl-CoA-carboxylase] ligase [Coriobacteriaceae bacterium]